MNRYSHEGGRYRPKDLARFPRVRGAVLVEPNAISGRRRPTRAAILGQSRLCSEARPVSPVETLTVGIVTHGWIEVAPVPGTHLNAIRELVEVTTSDATITADLHQIRPV